MRAAMPMKHQQDCEEKRDPDETRPNEQRKRKKEKELDQITQLEKQTSSGQG